MDKKMMEQREKMFCELNILYDNMDKNLQLQRELVDKEVKLQRVAVGQTLKRAHEEMDRNVKQQRVKMDMANMQARAYMDKNLREARREMDYKLKLQQLRMEAKIMQERAKIVSKEECRSQDVPSKEQSPPPYAPKKWFQEESRSQDVPSKEQSPPPYSPKKWFQEESRSQDVASKEQSLPPYVPKEVIFSFRVFRDRDISRVPRGYNDPAAEFRFTEPATKVIWDDLLSSMHELGYRYHSDLYHIKPGCIPPEGMSILLSQEDLDQIIRAHSDTKKCELYLVTNRHFRGDGYDETDEENEDDEAYDLVINI